MAITSIKRSLVGDPSIVHITTDDNLATVTGATYVADQSDNIESLNHGAFDWQDNELALIQYSDGEGYFSVAVSDGDVTLTPDNADIASSANSLAYFTDSNGSLGSSDHITTDEDSDLLTVAGTVIADKDNATSFRLKGASNANDPSGGADVQSYSGMFNNDSYDTVGTLKTRATFGANTEMDLALQSPHALLLIAQDGNESDGVVIAASQTNVRMYARYGAEQVPASYAFFDRTTTGSTGDDNTSPAALNTNADHLYLQNGVTDQAIVLPKVADGDVTNLTAGILIYDTDTNKLMFYNGSAWETVTSS